jgi:hypothetical protein
LIHPTCGTMTTLVLPWVLRRSFGDTFRGRTVGLYLSVLFIPAMVSIALVFLFFVQHVHLPKWPVLAMRATSSDFVPSLFIVASAVPLAVATLRCHVPVTRSVPRNHWQHDLSHQSNPGVVRWRSPVGIICRRSKPVAGCCACGWIPGRRTSY